MYSLFLEEIDLLFRETKPFYGLFENAEPRSRAQFSGRDGDWEALSCFAWYSKRMSSVSGEWYDLGFLWIPFLWQYWEAPGIEATILEDEGLNQSLDVTGKGGPRRLENWEPVEAAAPRPCCIQSFAPWCFPLAFSLRHLPVRAWWAYRNFSGIVSAVAIQNTRG